MHAQLQTQSKMFCADATAFGQSPNTQLSTISLAHPGTLPKANKLAFEYAIRMGLACNAEISRYNIFDRKNYFYPDLPKGYQLTQDRTPICKKGYVSIVNKSGEQKNIMLNRIHLEEDAGKSIHPEAEQDSLVDFNRAGVPLIEIVTEPCINSAEDAYAFLTEVRKLVRYLDICDGNMEEGSLRCDANISVKPSDAKVLGKKVEVKNMNSIRNVQRAIEFEFRRQIELLEKGEEVISETRSFDADTGKTFSMRTKEELNDYRYFPDPDLSPVIVSEDWLAFIRQNMPALPAALEEKLMHEFKLPAYDARVLTESKEMAAYFLDVCTYTNHYKAVSNWMMGPVKSFLNNAGLSDFDFPLHARALADIISLVDENKLSFSAAAQNLLPAMINAPEKSAFALAQELNLLQDSNEDAILDLVKNIIKDHPDKVMEFKKGKKGILAFFMGELMKRSKGKADPKMAATLFNKELL